MMSNLFTILGIDSELLNRCSQNERNFYSVILLGFVVLNIVGLLSFVYFFLILTGSWVIGVLLAMLLSFIYFNVLRFTLLTIRLPIGEEFTWGKLFTNVSNMLRLILCTIYFLSMAIPLLSWFKDAKIDLRLEQEKDHLVNEYKESRRANTTCKLLNYDNFIRSYDEEKMVIHSKNLEPELIEFQINQIDQRIIDLKIKRKAEKNLLEKEDHRQSFLYAKAVKEAGMPFNRFRILFEMPHSYFELVLIMFPMISLVFLFMYLTYSSQFQYGKLANSFEKIFIQTRYKDYTESVASFLLSEYNYKLPTSNLYEDPPFNRVQKFKGYIEIKDQSAFDYFHCQP
jgi:hypothetical protein